MIAESPSKIINISANLRPNFKRAPIPIKRLGKSPIMKISRCVRTLGERPWKNWLVLTDGKNVYYKIIQTSDQTIFLLPWWTTLHRWTNLHFCLDMAKANSPKKEKCPLKSARGKRGLKISMLGWEKKFCSFFRGNFLTTRQTWIFQIIVEGFFLSNSLLKTYFIQIRSKLIWEITK